MTSDGSKMDTLNFFLKNGSNDFFRFWPEVSTKYDLQFEWNLFFRKIPNLEEIYLEIAFLAKNGWFFCFLFNPLTTGAQRTLTTKGFLTFLSISFEMVWMMYYVILNIWKVYIFWKVVWWIFQKNIFFPKNTRTQAPQIWWRHHFSLKKKHFKSE